MVKKRKRNSVKVDSNKRRIRLSVINLILFVLFSIISYVIYKFAVNDLMSKSFFLLTLVLSFIAVAFLIILLILLILKMMKNK